LTAILVNPPSHGTVVLFNGDGSFQYVPTAGFTGTDTFRYRASDGVDQSDLAVVTITVNAANHVPVALADSYTTDTNTPLSVGAPGVLANDIDADGDILTAIQVGSPAHGAVAFSSDGSFLFTPDTGYVGFDSFSYSATDGVTTSAPIAIVIGVGFNDNAPIAASADYAIDEDLPLVVAAPGVLTGATGDHPLTAFFVSGPQHGGVTLNADGSFTYTPDENFNGTDYFVFRANDGIVNSSDAIVTITVNSVNDGPELSGDLVYGTPQDTTLNAAAPGVLGGATDADGDTLTTVLTSDVSSGVLT